ncbi:MAG: helix-turn-helix domain-containing protein [Candidatus Brocadiia bacterium]
MDIGDTIRRLRKKRGLTQVELADAAGVSQATISLIESGDRDISMNRLRSVSEALETEPEVILWKSLDMPEELPNDQKLLIQAAELIVEKVWENGRQDEEQKTQN